MEERVGMMLLPCLLCVIISMGECSIERSLFTSAFKHLVPRVKRQASGVAHVPSITDFCISSRVQSRFATVKISSAILNPKTDSTEATFSVQIPESAFISKFTMIIDNKNYVSKVYQKKEAQTKYDKAKEEGQTAGHIRHDSTDSARGMDIFSTSVNVAAESEVFVELTYLQLLERRLGLYEQRIMVQPRQIVDNLTLNLIYEEGPQYFDRFTYRPPNSNDVMDASSEHATLTASLSRRQVTYNPPVTRQTQVNADRGIDGEFVVSYDLKHGFDGGNIISALNNDYFVHYFAVDKSHELPPVPKNIIFVIDVSGSMGGRKIQQTRDAMKQILLQLNGLDYFNILLFSSGTVAWQTEPLQATPNNIRRATVYVDAKVQAGGPTNINSALVDSMKIVFRDTRNMNLAAIVVFLTDGQPTSGETVESTIRVNVRRNNFWNRIALFSLGFGSGVNYNFLQEISWENGGFARRIYEEDDAAKQLTDFFKEVNIPLLLNVKFQYNTNQVDTSKLTRTTYNQFFSGTEVVVVGRRLGDVIDATVQGSTATAKTVHLVVPEASKKRLSGPSGEFTERLWAYLTIKDLLKKKAIATSMEEGEVLEARALNMSLMYGFVTPLTSFVVAQEQPVEEDYAYDRFNVLPTNKDFQLRKRYAIPASESAAQVPASCSAFVAVNVVMVIVSFLLQH
ncbi:inter-alpha-trypsin inhibitor heavy chain H3-like [Haliotis cracherodii]|uniref:inter-alpha-trypsin inhibitor heavy chain H3-like n=1 Tax=Haliotis cracherodii TaxID=6455 RepID=UPI0039ED784F